MHKKIPFLLAFILLVCSNKIFAQTSTYFQQQVDYTLDVTLDDTLKTLSAFENITYTNNSPDTLHQLFFHLWANAYKNDRSAFCKQKVLFGDTKFYFSKPQDKGYINGLAFTINDKAVTYSEYNNNPDVIILSLNEPLLPKQSIHITTPFTVKIPKLFSRMGHNGKQDFEITQWYPAPAVYDSKGWHPMPYLDQGEFYAEWGNYTVNITLPQNYVVAATGNLQTATEQAFIDNNIAQTKNLDSAGLAVLRTKKIPTIYQNKTITFTQDSVHDFAWFANKHFLIEKKEQTLPNGKNVNCYLYYLPQNSKLWKGESETIAYCTNYLSQHIGNYKYNNITAVDGGLLAGSGMEYPTITVIGKLIDKNLLKIVLAHEIGHNWFQGMLANNERDYPFMDEGFNSFYDNKLSDSLVYSIKANKKNLLEESILLYKIQAKYHNDQAINIPSESFTKLNYDGIAYAKTANVLAHLENYLGTDVMENCMKNYFTAFAGKHPYPNDVQTIFENTSGKNLHWFFGDVLNTTKKEDIKIQKVQRSKNKATITLKNKADLQEPVAINSYLHNSLVHTTWVEPFANRALVEIPTHFDKIILDEKNSLDKNLTNNYYFQNHLLHTQQYKLGLLFGVSETKKQTSILPALGYNYYDGVMAGLVVHNIGLRANPFQYAVAPMYGFRSKAFAGTGFASYLFYPKTTFQNIKIGVHASLFHNDQSKLNIPQTIFTHYLKIVPNIEFTCKPKDITQAISDVINISDYIIGQNSYGYTHHPADSTYSSYLKPTEFAQTLVLHYTHTNARTFNPFSYALDVQANKLYVKTGLTGNITMHYNKPNKALYIRAFAGKFFTLASSSYDAYPYRLSATYNTSNENASNDYLYQNYYIARNISDNFLEQQVSEQEGGMKLNTNKLSNRLGMSNNWLASINIKTDLPIDLPIKVRGFLDVCTSIPKSDYTASTKENLMDAGLQISLLKNTFLINLPLFMSKNYSDYYKSMYSKNVFIHMVSFSININDWNFTKLKQFMKLN